MNNDDLTFGFYEVTEETPKDKLLMFFPNTQDYVEIMGHRIDFQGGCKEFIQYLAKLTTYEEENKKLKRSADILDEIKNVLEDFVKAADYFGDNLRLESFRIIQDKIKELEEKYNESICDRK